MTANENEAQNAPKLEGAALEAALLKQVEYYFSRANLSHDTYLISQMDAQMFVPISTIANFKMVKQLTSDLPTIVRVLKNSSTCVVNDAHTHVRPNFGKERNTIILREIPSTTKNEEVEALFKSEEYLKVAPPPVSVSPDIHDHWFVTFSSEEATLKAFDFISTKQFNGRPIAARIKSENILRGFYIPNAAHVSAFYQMNASNYNGKRREGNFRRSDSYKRKGKKDGKSESTRTVRQDFNMGLNNFPPLDGAPEPTTLTAGYQAEFKKYGRSDFVNVLRGLSKDTKAPTTLASSADVALTSPDFQLEAEKPLRDCGYASGSDDESGPKKASKPVAGGAWGKKGVAAS